MKSERNTNHAVPKGRSDVGSAAVRADRLVTVQSGEVSVATLPKMLHKGPLVIGEAKIMAFVLDDERRVLSGRSVTKGLGLTGRGAGMARFLNSGSLRPYIKDDLREAIENPTLFEVAKGLPLGSGYEAWVLPELCHTIIDAWEAQALHSSLAKTVANAKTLVRGFSTVGIIALVDEATGYQESRRRDALQELLAKYISDRLLPWTQTFPREFYEQIFRLWGWNWRSMDNRRPRLVGKITRDIVYDRISPQVLAKLEEENPVVQDGRRRYKHFQYLSTDYGMPALKTHLEGVMALMRASPNKAVFLRLLARAYPKRGQVVQEELIPDAVEFEE